jgi:two-component system, NarL family, response regulator LiaR
MEKIKIHIVEDHQIFRQGLKVVLSDIPNVEVIAESSNGKEFLAQLSIKVPDIVFMDIKMPEMDGIKATEEALLKYPDLKIIILSMFGEEEYIQRMIQLGICGFILKNSDKTVIEKAIQLVSTGNHYFSSEIMTVLARSIYKSSREKSTREEIDISERELELLNNLSQGLSNKEIADKMFISPRTVEGYKSKLMQKTGLNNSLNLILWAIKNNIVNSDI